MANRFWVGGAATWDATAGSKWALTSGGAGGQAVPTSSDDVFFDATSGANTVTMAGTGVCTCNNLDCTGFTGTFAFSGTTRIDVAGNLKIVAGMTMPASPTSAQVFNFTATATGKTVASGGKTMPGLTFNGVGGGWTLQDNHTGPSSGNICTITLTNGTLDLNGKTVNNYDLNSNNGNTRSLTMGAASFTTRTGGTWNITNSTGMTFSGASATIVVTGGSTGTTFNGGGLTYGTVTVGSGAANTSVMDGTNTFTNLTLNAVSGTTTGKITLGADQIASTALALTGNSATARVQITSDTAGTVRTLTCNGTVTPSNAVLQDITGAGSASWAQSGATGFGDMGGNSGITFTTAINIFYFRNTGNLSTSANFFLATNGGGGAARVPLPQDTLFFDSTAFSIASQTFTASNQLFVPALDFTGATNTPTLALSSSKIHCGSITLISGMNLTSATITVTPAANGSISITSAGKSFGSLTVEGRASSVVTLSDAFISTGTLTLTRSGLTASGSVQALIFSSSNSNTRTLTMGTGTWTLTSTGTIWSMATTTGLTVTPGSSTIVINEASATSKTFAGGGKTYNNITFSGDNIIVTGANTFNIFAINNAGLTTGLKMTAGTTTTVTDISSNGFAANLTKLLSATAATHTINSSSGVDLDFMSITNSIAAGATPFYAGANSTNGGGNTNWTFTGRPGSVATFSAAGSLAAVGKTVRLSTATLSASATFAARSFVPAGVLTAAAHGVLTAVGKTVRAGVATLAGHGIATAVGAAQTKGVATVSAHATLAAVGKSNAAGVATLAAHGVLTPVGKSLVNRAAAWAAQAVFAPIGRALIPRAATWAGHGVLAAVGKSVANAVATLAGHGVFTPAGKSIINRVATFSAAGSLTGVGRATTKGVATIAAHGTLAGVGKSLAKSVATLSSTAVFAVHSIITGAKFTAAATGALAAVGKTVRLSTATLSAHGTLAGVGKSLNKTTATFTASASLAGVGKTVRKSVAAWNANATFAAVGRENDAGVFTMAAHANLAAVGITARKSVATLSASAALAARGRVLVPSQFGMAAASQFNAVSHQLDAAAATISAQAALVGISAPLFRGTASFGSNAVFAAVGRASQAVTHFLIPCPDSVTLSPNAQSSIINPAPRRTLL